MSSILKQGTKKRMLCWYCTAISHTFAYNQSISVNPCFPGQSINSLKKTEHTNPTHTSVHNFHVEDNQIHTNQAALVLRVASNNCTCWLLRNHSPSVASNNLHMLFNGKRLLAHRTVTILVVPFACGSLCCISFCSANVGQILLWN